MRIGRDRGEARLLAGRAAGNFLFLSIYVWHSQGDVRRWNSVPSFVRLGQALAIVQYIVLCA